MRKLIFNFKSILKILFVILFIWLIYVNYFLIDEYNIPSSILLGALTGISFLCSFCWIGLPFSYITKRFLNKLGKLFMSKLSEKTRLQIKAFDFISGPFDKMLSEPFYLLVLPLAFGGIILFQVVLNFFPITGDILFSRNIFFIIQFLGLLYFYCGLSGKFDKYFDLISPTHPEKTPKDIEKGLESISSSDFYIGGLILIIVSIILKIFLFENDLLGWLLFGTLLGWGIWFVVYGKFFKK